MKQLSLLLLVLISFSCKKGDPGPKGDTGLQGPAGPKSITLDFKYVHTDDALGANYENQILHGQGGLSKYYDRNTDEIRIYMKAGAVDNTTTNFTLVPLPVLFQDSIKFEYRVLRPDSLVKNNNILYIHCYIPTKYELSSGNLSGHYPYGKRDTTVYYRAVIIKGDKPILAKKTFNFN